MAKEAGKKEETLSKSKEKRMQRQKEVAKEKKEKKLRKVIGILVTVIVVCCLITGIGISIYKAANKTTSISDFSKGLTDQGLVEGISMDSCLTLADYENMVVPMSEVAATAEEVDADIQSVLEANKELVEDKTLAVEDGNKVNIDYVGTIDEVAFEGGDSQGQGYDLTIGSGTFVDDFEEQLIGTHPGEEVTVNVTFPEDYSAADLAGKDASFAVTVHGIYVTPEFTDEFVKEHLSEEAATAEEYRAAVEKKYYESHLKEYIQKYIKDNSTMKSYPKKFLKTIKGILKYNDEYTLQYYNQMFSQYGMGGYENVWDTREGIDSEEAYEKELTERAKDAMKESFVYQSVFEKAGLSLDMDAYLAELTESYGEEYVSNMKEMYGVGYMAQSKISEMVMDYLMEHANVQ